MGKVAFKEVVEINHTQYVVIRGKHKKCDKNNIVIKIVHSFHYFFLLVGSSVVLQSKFVIRCIYLSSSTLIIISNIVSLKKEKFLERKK